MNRKINGITRKDFLKKGLGAAGLLSLAGSGVFSLVGCDRPGDDTQQEVEELIGKMNLDEKISQLRYDAPAIERLNIPEYNWWNECLHGIGRAGLATVFPQAIGMAASWDAPLIHRVSKVISNEGRAKHNAFVKRGLRQIYMGLTFWSPNINLVRDPRWGRGQETYGEDPYLTGEMALQFIKGLQGDDEDNLKVVATAKHFAVYNGPESLRHEVDVHVSPLDLHETYLPMFEKTVKEGNVSSVMCAYNSVNGMPCCSNNPLLNDILRNDWDFDGYVVSDCWAVNDIWEEKDHNVAKDAPEAAAMALSSGTDLNCGNSFRKLNVAVKRGLIKEETIDKSLQRLFEARYQLGLIDGEEEGPFTDIPYSVVCSSDHKQRSLEMSRESIVLLKNEPYGESQSSLLPLSDNIKKLAVIGPNADDDWVMLGNYHGTPDAVTTPLKGIQKKAKDRDIQVKYALGSDVADEWPSLSIISAEYLIPSKGSGAGLYAEYFKNDIFEGSPAKTKIDKQINFSWKDDTPITGKMADTFSVRWSGKLKAPKTGEYTLGFKGKNGYKVYINGALKMKQNSPHDARQKRSKINLKAGEECDIKIEFINHGPDPQAHFGWCLPDRNLVNKALDVAKESDAVVLCMGINSTLEGEERPVKIDGFKGGDRTNIQLPESQVQLMKKLHQLGKPTALVLLSGSALSFPWAKQEIPAIIQAWYGGQEGGAAIADVLFGDYNPGGRLPVTFYESVEDIPSFTDYNMDGRTYKYFKGKPFYPFGYGLSYTKFKYSDLQLPEAISKGDSMQAKVTVRNYGEVDGDEVIQLYISHPEAKIRKPIRSLQGFKRISIAAGESKTVTFNLNPEQLALIGEDGSPNQPEGSIGISIGGKQPGFNGSLDVKTTHVLQKTVSVG